MDSREVISRLIHHKEPQRFGYFFIHDNPTDIVYGETVQLDLPYDARLNQWGQHKELLDEVGGFNGDVRLDIFGNIFGRLEDRTHGECIKGFLTDDWSRLDKLKLPTINEAYSKSIDPAKYKNNGKYNLGSLPVSIFASLRDTRLISNALMDTLTEPENVTAFLDRITVLMMQVLDRLKANGLDGVITYDDLGTQISTFFSPETFRELFKPQYKKVIDHAHSLGLDFFVHSCGHNVGFMDDFIEVGVDVFQFDQPEVYDSTFLAKEYGKKVTFFNPIDIQAVVSTGNRELIEATTMNVINSFKQYAGGGMIFKDYLWDEINVDKQWAQWARDLVFEHQSLV